MEKLQNEYLILKAEREKILVRLNSTSWANPLDKLKTFHLLWDNCVRRVFVKLEMDKYASQP